MPARRPRRPRRLTLVAVLALAAAACGPTTSPTPSPGPTTGPTPSPAPTSSATTPTASPQPSEDLSALYREINEQVVAIRGLEARQPIEPTIVSPDEMAEILQGLIREDTPPELLAAYEQLYHAMGLLPENETLADVYLDLLESQVGGLYDNEEKRLYVVSKAGGVGPLEKVLYSHEYVHALQDQHFDLTAFQPDDLTDETDRQLARQAVVEGDAYTAMSFWLRSHLTPTELLAFLTESQDPEVQQALEGIPPIVAVQITFPAAQGFLWIAGIQAQGGWEAVDDAFERPPDSTEQILHAAKWESREPPIAVDIPDDLASRLGAGWSVALEDSLGEAQVAVWLSGTIGAGGLPPPPPQGAAGWGGDRLVLLDGPGDQRAVVVRTQWDSAEDAAEFEAEVTPKLEDAPGIARVLPGAGGTERWVLFASDDATLGLVAGVLGLAG